MSDVGGPAVESVLPARGVLPTATALGKGPKLFSPQQIAIATFLGSPLAGGILLAISHRRAKTGRGYQAILIGAATTAVTGVLLVALGLDHGALFLPCAGVLGMQALMRAQMPRIVAATAETWQPAPWGPAIGAGLGGLAIILGLGWVALARPPAVDFGHHQTVQYEHGATAADARAVGAFMQSAGLFSELGRPMTLRVERIGGRVVVSFAMQDGAWDHRDTIATFENVRTALEGQFVGEHVAIHLCDVTMDNQRTIE